VTYVLLTRPEEDCQELKNKLIIPVISSPLLKVIKTPKKLTLPAGVTDLIITSARVFEVVTNIRSMTSLPVWCVGEVTAAAAKAIGFETIFQVNRSAQEILERIATECPKESTHFAHLCGSVLYVDLADALTKLGFKTDKLIVYTTKAIKELTPEAEALIRAGLVQQMPFFSLRTAEIFIDLAQKSEWGDQLTGVIALAHSESISRALRQLSWKDVIVVPDLSADRILEYYRRPEDHLMTKKFFIGHLLTAAVTAACVAFLTVWMGGKILPQAQKFPGGQVSQSDLQKITQKVTQDLSSTTEQLKTLKEEEKKLQALIETTTQLVAEVTELKADLKRVQAGMSPLPFPSAQPEQQDFNRKKERTEAFRLFYRELTKGVVHPDSIGVLNRYLGPDHQIPLSVISVRDLADQLQRLPEIKREINLEINDSIWTKLMTAIGLRVRRTESLPLKDQALRGLKELNFNFLETLDSLHLSPEWSEWVRECHQTRQVLALLQEVLHAEEAPQ
jgi:uroporphyrinogen-III synthase